MSKEAAWFDDQTEPAFGAYHGGPHNIQMVHGGMNDNTGFGWRRPVVYDEHDDRLYVGDHGAYHSDIYQAINGAAMHPGSTTRHIPQYTANDGWMSTTPHEDWEDDAGKEKGFHLRDQVPWDKHQELTKRLQAIDPVGATKYISDPNDYMGDSEDWVTGNVKTAGPWSDYEQQQQVPQTDYRDHTGTPTPHAKYNNGRIVEYGGVPGDYFEMPNFDWRIPVFHDQHTDTMFVGQRGMEHADLAKKFSKPNPWGPNMDANEGYTPGYIDMDGATGEPGLYMFKTDQTPHEDEFHQWVEQQHGIKRPTGALPPSLQNNYSDEKWSKTSDLAAPYHPWEGYDNIVKNPEPIQIGGYNIHTLQNGPRKKFQEARTPLVVNNATKNIYVGADGDYHEAIHHTWPESHHLEDRNNEKGFYINHPSANDAGHIGLFNGKMGPAFDVMKEYLTMHTPQFDPENEWEDEWTGERKYWNPHDFKEPGDPYDDSSVVWSSVKQSVEPGHSPEPPEIEEVETNWRAGQNGGDAWMDNRRPFIFHPELNKVFMGNMGTHHGHIQDALSDDVFQPGQQEPWRGMLNTNPHATPDMYNDIHWWPMYGTPVAHPEKAAQIEQAIRARYPLSTWTRETEAPAEPDWDNEHWSSNMEDEWVADDEPVFSITAPEPRWRT